MADEEPASVPADDPVPFAEEPKPECCWPLRSSDSRRFDVACEAMDGTARVEIPTQVMANHLVYSHLGGAQ